MASEPKVTRRDLLRSMGVAAVAASCANDSERKPEDTQDPASVDVGPAGEPVALEFELDGRPVSTEIPVHVTLLELMRVDLKVTAAKEICDRGSCGGCMVLVDGTPMNSCMMLAHDAAGKQVTTAAGLGSSKQLSVLQQSFVDHDALQCGFCTSGMLVTSAALLREGGGKLDRAAVRRGISGNLCRCGSYPHVVDAVMHAQKVGDGGGA